GVRASGAEIHPQTAGQRGGGAVQHVRYVRRRKGRLERRPQAQRTAVSSSPKRPQKYGSAGASPSYWNHSHGLDVIVRLGRASGRGRQVRRDRWVPLGGVSVRGAAV